MKSCVPRLFSIWMPKKAECMCRKVGKKLRRPALHAFIKHGGTKLARIEPPNTLTDSYIRFLSKTEPYLNLLTRTPESEPHFITLPMYTVLIHRSVVYGILLLCEVHPVLLHCWTEHQQNHIAELYPSLTHYWGIANINTLQSYNLS